MRDFFNDVVQAYPELELFFITEHPDRPNNSSSGNSAETEYQRTIGALFAVYWMMRLDGDGKAGFSFGCDEQWQVYSEVPDKYFSKQEVFFNDMEWEDLQKVTSLALHGSVGRI
mmetsp:Transcript_71128/g.180063  ORF Transcript_71128/g.180063 Transcript_71128/m.180063 type:complete len:114 (+) Transcript_71128:2288-2629(+)